MQRVLVLASFLLTVGCTIYSPKPLDRDQIWAELNAVNLSSFSEIPAEREHKSILNIKDGLSMDEVTRVALVLNPNLQALRTRMGMAEGELLQSRLFTNPEVDVSWFLPNSDSGEVDLLFDVYKYLFTRATDVSRAKLLKRQIKWEIAHQEWQVVNAARQAYIDVVFWDEFLTLNNQKKELANRTLEILLRQKKRGASSSLDEMFSQLELSNTLMETLALEGQRKLALQALNFLLGLPPEYRTPIQKPDHPLAFVAVNKNKEELYGRVRTSRFDLLAKEKSYLVAEKELKLEVLQQFPHFKFGPSFDSDDGDLSLGIGFSIELPIFNQNQGQIAIKEANRERIFKEYQEMLHQARKDFTDAWTDLKSLEGQLKLYMSDIKPKLDKSLKLTETAFLSGEISLVDLLTLQGNVIKKRQSVMRQLRDYQKTRIKVDDAVGPKFEVNK